MSQQPAWRRYLRLFGPDVGSDVDGELQFHLERRTEELVEKGWSAEAAHEEALRLFGDVRKISSECRRLGHRRLRAKRRESLFGEIRRDLAFAVRVAMGRRLLSAVIVVSLALGIGVNIAIFTVAKGVLLDRLPVEHADELVLFKWIADDWTGLFSLRGSVNDTDTGGISCSSFSYSGYRRFAERQNVLSSVFAFAPIERMNVNLDGEAILADGELVSGSFFPGLGVKPQIGRLIGAGDDRLESEPVAVLSHAFWRRRFGSDPSVMGRLVHLNGNPFTVVGVAPKDFKGTLQVGSSPAIYVPLSHVQKVVVRQRVLESVDHWFLRVMGRLEPEVDIEEARSALAPLLHRTVAEDLGVEPGPDGRFDRPVPNLALLSGARGLDERRADMVGALTITLGVTVLVLLIACANSATLLLAAAVARRREMAVRLSLGAGRARIARQLMTENMLLSAAGGVFGLILSHWVSRGMVLLLSSDLESQLALDLSPDLSVFGFAILASLLTGVMFGIGPVLRMPSVQLAKNLQQGDDRVGHARSSFRVGKLLVVGQVALSLILLIVAGLFVRTVSRLGSVDPGFTADGMLMFRVDPALNRYEAEELVRVCDEIKIALGTLPSVESTSFASFSLVSGSGSWARFNVSEDKKVGSFIGAVDPGFLGTTQIELLEGRDFSPDDRADSPLVAIVNQTFARKAFGEESAIGREFSAWRGEERDVIRIVGVFRDGNSIRLRQEPGPIAYVPHRQASRLVGQTVVTFYVRTAQAPATFAESIRSTVTALDRDLAVFDIRYLSAQISESMAQERNFLFLSGVGAAFGLALACIGLYGTVSFSMSRRIREIGIRMTLGASRRDILLSALRELDMVVVGVVLGLGGAWLLTRWLDDLLFKLAATDPFTMTTAAIVMTMVGVIAIFLPARRATLVDPIKVLRSE